MKRWFRLRRAPIWALLVTLAAPAGAAGVDLDGAQEMLDAGRPDAALQILSRGNPGKGPAAAQAYLLRSTARFMLGQMESGRRDLDHSLRLDPSLRQAWLNRAALDIAEERLDAALEALHKARELDPEASDTDLNIGAVLAMQGRASEARPHFDRYLASNPDSAEAWMLVSSNYALSGDARAAVEHLARSISLDERIRRRARTDANLARIADDASFQQLLSTDNYRIPAGSHAIFRRYEERYLAGEGKLLPAVLDALQLSGEPFDRQIEVTADWTLIWGELRIKVRNDPREGGRVELTAPRTSFSDEAWQERTKRLFAEISVQIAKR